MEKIGERFAGLSGGTSGQSSVSLMEKVRHMEDAFRGGKERTLCHTDESGWRGEIDVHLRKLLDKLGAFLEWVDAHRPRRRKQFKRMLIGLDPSGRPLSAPLVQSNWKTWKEVRNYFVLVSHHRKPTGLKNMHDKIAVLEGILAERLVPRTSADSDAIDSLIEETRDA